MNHAHSEGDAAVVVYLELANALVDRGDAVSAIAQLEGGIALLSRLHEPGPVWRLQLTLAALYDGNGQRESACRTTRAAHAQASRTSSTVGRARSHDLLQRLLHGQSPSSISTR